MLEPALRTGTPCPVSASAITDPKVGAELIAAGFKGLLIGTGLLAQRQRPGLGRRVRAASRHAGLPPSTQGLAMSDVLLRPLRRAGATSQPDAPALIWDGEHDQLRRARRDGGERRCRPRRLRAPGRPPGRHPRAEVAGGDRADPRLPAGASGPFLLPSVELAPETLGQAVRAGGRQPRARAAGPAQRERQPARDRGHARRGGGAVRSGRRPAAATTSRSCSPRRARPGCRRSCRCRRAPSTASPTGPPRSSTSAPARTSRTTRRSTSTSACSTSGRRSSTAAASRSSTRTARRTAATSPI